MEQIKRVDISVRKSSKNGDYVYLIMNILLLFILPLLSIASECIVEKESMDWILIGKWFIFWAIGIRLFTAGIKQSSNPEFTAVKIFKMKSSESFVVIRELGFANIALGVMGILSVINSNWRILAAITGGLFFGLAGIQHLFKRPDSRNELIAMLYDLIVLLMIVLYLVFTLFF
ncbi:MAG TPA: DUF6790 family protein [Puia sp.]|nr:DUF6790 family protein [Puia sp.]